MSRALVLGGGGVTGIAWELGALLGLRDEGVDLVDVDLTIGTSAGAATGAELHSGVDLEELVARQIDPVHHEIAADLDLDLLIEVFGELAGPRPFDAERLARVGGHALAATTVPEAVRRTVIEHRLPNHEWPTAPLRLTAVDAVSGAFAVFDAASGVPLVDAVAASCAVPGIWPPVSINGHRYMDGGVRSPTNADLATGADQVVVLAPLSTVTDVVLDEEVAALRSGGSIVAVLTADEAAVAEMGPNALDPVFRAAAVQAGRRQGRAAAADLAAALA